MPVVNEKNLPTNKWLEHCEQGELIRGQLHRSIEWAIVGASGNELNPVVILSGPDSPYWFNAYSTSEMGVLQILCLSYWKDYWVIPNYSGEMNKNEAGAFAILDNEYGIVIGGVPGSGSSALRHFHLTTFRLEGPRGGNVSYLAGWSIWKEGLTANGEPQKLLQFP